MTNCSDKDTESENKKYDSLLDQVSDKDTLYLMCEDEGCFGGDKKVVKIFDKNGSLFAFYNWAYYDTTYVLNNSLNDSSIILYKQFEHEGKVFKNQLGMCTSTYTYSVKVKADGFQFIDKDCYFNLYERFIKKTFVFPEVD